MRFAWLVLLWTVGAAAQSTEADLRAKLVGKPLILRGCYREDRLHFDAAGKVRDRVHTVPFTLSGVDVDGLELRGNKLLLTGRRVGLKFKTDGQERVPLMVSRSGGMEEEGVEIEVAAPTGGDFGAVLAQIFVSDLKEMVPLMSEIWQVWARRELLGEGPQLGTEPKLDGLAKIGGNVSPPKVLHMPEPEFTQEMRKMRLSGTTLVYLQLPPDGKPEKVRIQTPAGMGLDEKAVDAVKLYRFQPAMEDGKPVRVEMQVEVHFEVY